MTKTPWLCGALAALAALAAGAQEKDEFADFCRAYAKEAKKEKAYVAEVRVKIRGKYEDSAEAREGRIWWKEDKKGPRILWETRDPLDRRTPPERVVLKGGEEEPFAPAWVLRTGPVKEWRESYDVSIVARPEETAMPERVVTREGGEPLPTPRAKLPRANVALGGSAMRPSAGRHTVIELRPKDKGGSLLFLRVFVAKETMRIEKVVMETETHSTIVRVSGHTPRESLDDSLFEQERREK